ncbi:MAG TPA: ASPIC/UnbV domain-containing protein, partial [Isosphaeraceae bacterium]|nr:ASPIC/UnbV domain-containing protein [Isosphaeraceae bacterium]
PRLLIGIGRETEARKVTVRWPSGRIAVAEHLAADQSYLVVEEAHTTDQDARHVFRIIGGERRSVPADRSAR